MSNKIRTAMEAMELGGEAMGKGEVGAAGWFNGVNKDDAVVEPN